MSDVTDDTRGYASVSHKVHHCFVLTLCAPWPLRSIVLTDTAPGLKRCCQSDCLRHNSAKWLPKLCHGYHTFSQWHTQASSVELVWTGSKGEGENILVMGQLLTFGVKLHK